VFVEVGVKVLKCVGFANGNAIHVYVVWLPICFFVCGFKAKVV
jgi:hypothetical protein